MHLFVNENAVKAKVPGLPRTLLVEDCSAPSYPLADVIGCNLHEILNSL